MNDNQPKFKKIPLGNGTTFYGMENKNLEQPKGVPIYKNSDALLQKPTPPSLTTLNILALDVATKTGWATQHASGLWNFTIKKDESGGMKLIRLRTKLREICEAEQINLIVFERTSGQHKAAIIHQSELHGVLKLFCEENSIQYKAYSASEIKSFAAGKGNAGKPAMIAAAKQKYGYTGEDDNVADALHIYHLALNDLKHA